MAVASAIGCGAGAVAAGAQSPHHGNAAPHRGGTLTVLEASAIWGAWPGGFDPATTTTGGSNQDMMDAIYGGLIQLGPKGHPQWDLATGMHFLNHGASLQIDIRKGVTFSDGTPLTAWSVVWNYTRDFNSPSCNCRSAWPIAAKNPFQVVSKYVVQVNFAHTFAPAINSFYDSQMNWIASPTAVRKMGEQKFAFMPVGAGPFVAVKDVVSSQFVVKRNAHYWQKGHPYLNGITFQSVADGEPELQAMEAGQGQVVVDMADPSLVSQYRAHGFALQPALATAPYFIEMNTLAAPFNNIKAREAIYYATNGQALNKEFFGGKGVPTESFTGPGGLFYEPKVPGYRQYDLTKARALVKQLGGLQVHLAVVAAALNSLLVQALQSQWVQAGINVTLSVNPLAEQLANFQTHNWQVLLTTMGSFDPAAGLGVNVRIMSNSPYSGVNDPVIDSLLTQAETHVNPQARARLYAQVAERISKEAYGPFLFTSTGYTAHVKGVTGPGITTSLPAVAVAPSIHWQDVARS